MKYFKLLGLTLLLAGFFIQPMYAQKIGTVSGIIINRNTKEKIPDAGIAIFKASDSAQVKGAFSNEKGVFLLDKIPFGNYFVITGFIGFEQYMGTPFEITAEKPILLLDTIRLQPKVIEMGGIEVVAKRAFIEQEAGKMIINPESDPAGTGDNILELFKKVPGVTVENDETIKLNGKSSVLILMDGKKTYLSGDALIMMLKNTPTSGVDKIEVITNPSEKYDAEGVSGILNIIGIGV